MAKSITDERRIGRQRLTPAARRALIEAGATRVFAERGYEAATMQEIARTAGVVASVLYDHYSSKQELYVELLERHGRNLIENTTQAPRSTDLRDELRHRIDAFFRSIEEDPFVWRMLFRDPPDDPKIAATHAQIHAKAASAIALALATDVDATPRQRRSASTRTTLVAEMIKSSLNGLAVWWRQHRQIERETIVDTATAVLWDGLSGIAEWPGDGRGGKPASGLEPETP